MSDGKFSGSCLCGAVGYEFEGEPRVTVACHCAMCRKVTGSAFATWSLVPLASFRWTKGEQELGEFQSSDHARRMFCRRCGGTLGNLTSRRPSFMHLAAGTLDVSPELRIGMHVYATSKVAWYPIADGAPQHEAEPTRG